MNKLIFTRRERGTSTPESIAEECRRNGHLIGIQRDPFYNGVRKYYLLGNNEKPMEITIMNNRIVSARRVPAKVIKTLPPLNPPKFGNF